MTRNLISLSMLAGILALTSCESEKKTDEHAGTEAMAPESDTVSRAYSDFLSQVKKDTMYWYDVDTNYWEGKKVEYERMAKGREAGRAKWSPAEVRRVDSIIHIYDTISTTAIKEREEIKQVLETTKPQPKLTYIGPAALADLDKVTGENIVTYYENFVATARNYRKEFTFAEWNKMKEYYEKLDKKKNEFERSTLSKEDNRRIAGLKVNYNTIRIPNKEWSEHAKPEKEKKNKSKE